MGKSSSICFSAFYMKCAEIATLSVMVTLPGLVFSYLLRSNRNNPAVLQVCHRRRRRRSASRWQADPSLPRACLPSACGAREARGAVQAQEASPSRSHSPSVPRLYNYNWLQPATATAAASVEGRYHSRAKHLGGKW